MPMPNIPSSPALRNSSREKMPCSSHSAAQGAISSLQKRVTDWRMRSCSSVKYGYSVVCRCTVCVLIGILRRLDLDQHLAWRHHLAGLDENSFYHAIHGGLNSLLHFHGFERNKWIARLDALALGNQDAQDLAWHGRVGRIL